jgi:hypothetical protein
MSPKIIIGASNSRKTGCFVKMSLDKAIKDLISLSGIGTRVPGFWLVHEYKYPFILSNFSIN